MVKHQTMDAREDVLLQHLGVRGQVLFQFFAYGVAFALNYAGFEQIQALLDHIEFHERILLVYFVLKKESCEK